MNRDIHDIEIAGTKFKVRPFDWGGDCNWTSFLMRGKNRLIGKSKEGFKLETGAEIKWITPPDQARLIETLAASVVEIELIEGCEEVEPVKSPDKIRDILKRMTYPHILDLGNKIYELGSLDKQQEQD